MNRPRVPVCPILCRQFYFARRADLWNLEGLFKNQEHVLDTGITCRISSQPGQSLQGQAGEHPTIGTNES